MPLLTREIFMIGTKRVRFYISKEELVPLLSNLKSHNSPVIFVPSGRFANAEDIPIYASVNGIPDFGDGSCGCTNDDLSYLVMSAAAAVTPNPIATGVLISPTSHPHAINLVAGGFHRENLFVAGVFWTNSTSSASVSL